MANRRQRRRCNPHAPHGAIKVRGFDDAVQLVLAVDEFGAREELVVLVRDDGIVTRIIVDPLGADPRVWQPRRPYDERGDERILNIVIVDQIQQGPPDAELVEAYERLRGICARIGHQMLDLFRTDGDLIQSMSIAVDPQAPWPNLAPPAAA